ncbi:MAG: hypothetical protein AMS24_02390 [Chlamydiae bacterium SM23_39]|nr:MAG: hypothetical protein AMS24_02390 [Chlamydiae bacterium SM23_39]
MKFFLISIFFFTSIIFSNENSNHIFYLIQQKKYKSAISAYQKIFKNDDFEILRKIALIILNEGSKSDNKEKIYISLFGAGISGSSKTIEILKKGLLSDNLYFQLTALHFLSTIEDETATSLLLEAVNSNFIETRFQAVYSLAIKKHPSAIKEIELLMGKLNKFFKPYFPHLFALIGTNESLIHLKNFLFDFDSNVRLETILTIAKNKRDDLLSLLRKIDHGNIAEKEALIFCLGELKDSHSIDKIKKYSNDSTPTIKLASLIALNKLENSQIEKIERLAQNEDLYAINYLRNISFNEKILLKFLKNKNKNIRLNAAISLLKKKNPLSINVIQEFLLEDDLIIYPSYSLGKTLECFQIIQNAKKRNLDLNQSLKIKESLLKDAMSLKEDLFLSLAEKILNKKNLSLIPSITSLLASKNSEKSISLLKKYSYKKDPITMDYCNLALYKIGKEGYDKYIKNCIERYSRKAIKIKNFSNESIKNKNRFFIELLLTLAEKKEKESIRLLIYALKICHPLNRYLISGLLLKATE